MVRRTMTFGGLAPVGSLFGAVGEPSTFRGVGNSAGVEYLWRVVELEGQTILPIQGTDSSFTYTPAAAGDYSIWVTIGYRYFVMQLAPFYIRQIQPGIEAATDSLGQERYKQSYEQGQAMSVEEATEFLLEK